MKNQLHLCASAVPLTEGLVYPSLCGEDIEDARFAFSWDELLVGASWRESLNTLSFCRHCLAKLDGVSEGSRYLYGVRRGERE